MHSCKAVIVMAALLEARNIKKAFPGVQALRGVDFELRRGEVYALVGENGAGKSTLVKIICGAYQRDDGEIRFDGGLVDQAPGRQDK